MSRTYIIGEFRERHDVASAVHALRGSGVDDTDIDIFSEEPVEFRPGVLDRPSHMSLVAVSGAAICGIGATALMRLAQYNYAVITGGMPVFSFWGTGVITYETTMMGAVFSTFGYFLWESKLFRKRDKTAPVPVVPPEAICLRLRCSGANASQSVELLKKSGAVRVEEKVTP
jgi:Protein of unknown function (DUF3341)